MPYQITTKPKKMSIRLIHTVFPDKSSSVTMSIEGINTSIIISKKELQRILKENKSHIVFFSPPTHETKSTVYEVFN